MFFVRDGHEIPSKTRFPISELVFWKTMHVLQKCRLAFKFVGPRSTGWLVDDYIVCTFVARKMFVRRVFGNRSREITNVSKTHMGYTDSTNIGPDVGVYPKYQAQILCYTVFPDIGTRYRSIPGNWGISWLTQIQISVYIHTCVCICIMCVYILIYIHIYTYIYIYI